MIETSITFFNIPFRTTRTERLHCTFDIAYTTVTVKKNSPSTKYFFFLVFTAPSKPVVKASGDPKTIEAQDRSPMTLPIGDNVTALSNTSVIIECPTTGVPKPIVTWTKNGQKISSGGRYLVQDDGLLLITEADEEDNARYTCTADNVAGKDSASSNVKIVGKLCLQ